MRETRTSWCFLIEDFVLQAKKPVRLPHLDFGTIGAASLLLRGGTAT